MKLLLAVFLLFSLLQVHAQEITLSGTMHRSNLEGGCWYLQSDSGGKRYELTGDSAVMMRLRFDEQHVVVRGAPAKGAASICMMGEIVRVSAIVQIARHAFDPLVSNLTLVGKVHRTSTGKWYVKTTSGLRYEYKNLPSKKYRHLGMKIQQKCRVLLQGTSTPDKMNGVILSDSLKTTPIAKKKIYDSR
jgi:hypothetical protein